MAAMRANTRLQVGSAPWVAEERSSALQIAAAETEEFTFSARNEVDWLNEHMAEIFSKNQVNVAEIFKTPGKLRGKTPRTARKINPLETRAPLSDVFSSTPRGMASPFKQIHFERPVPTFRVAEDEPEQEEEAPPISNAPKTSPPKPTYNAFDSGYHGSQPDDATQANEPLPQRMSPPIEPFEDDSMVLEAGEDDGENVEILGRDSEERRTTEGSFQSAKEEQMRIVPTASLVDQDKDEEIANTELEEPMYPVLESPLQSQDDQKSSSPRRISLQRNTPAKPPPLKEMALEETPDSPEQELPKSPTPLPQTQNEEQVLEDEDEDEAMDDVQSPSDGSSPMRPIVRKSSLNFASLPAREPITTKKSIGTRVSRTSHLDQSRTSYYGRLTGGKSIGNVRPEELDEDEDQVEGAGAAHDDDTESKLTRMHNKTSTQRLQDQISMLGQSQTNMRSSKSLASSAVPTAQAINSTNSIVPQETVQQKSPLRVQSPHHKERPPPPGAFPEDEDESWIGPPPAAGAGPSIFSPRMQMTKSHTTDVMEDIHGKSSIAGSQFDIPKRGEPRNPSPIREPVVPERTKSTLGQVKSVSTSILRSPKKAGDSPGSKKGISVSNPTPSISAADEEASTTPPKSPERSHRGSPLKAAKDKFSSILKSSRGLFASSAAVSAEAKSSALSPPSSKIDLRNAPSFEDVLSQANEKNPVYPSLDAHNKSSQLSFHMPTSPFKASARKTRASTEREEKRKEEEAREAKEAKEAKEAQKMETQLEKARSKVREQAHRNFIEQERTVKLQKELAARKEDEKQAKSQTDIPRATRSSPRKTKAQLEAEGIAAAAATTDELANKDIEMTEASHAMPPPAIPRPKSQIGRPGSKRQLKPAKEPIRKVKPPTVIRVDTGSQRGHQYLPPNSKLSATLQESLASSQSSGPSQGLRHKASTDSIQSKASTSSFKSAATKALEAAAKKREQDEQVAQRKREAKQELERQRAAIKEEERRKEEQQRRQEAEKQREIQRERERLAAQADAKKTAQRQAIEKRRLEMEKAKETRAPPPAARPQPSGEPTHTMLQEKALPPLPPQRGEAGPPKPIRMNTAVQRTQEDSGRPTSTLLHNTTKVPPKRPLQQDPEEHLPRPAIQRNGPSYQNDHQSKRRRTSENFDDDDDMTEPQPKMTAPPIRQSSSRQKEYPTKSLFPSGYANAPPPVSNLQRSTLISQHNISQPKSSHPMDMAQVSKAPIPFASSLNQSNPQHKTPARPGAPSGVAKSVKSAAKSSPRYQNGENIVLPEIHTDSEDEDSDAGDFPVQGWTNSPDLRRQLVIQETMNPAEIFGQPGPLNMEEVFSKSKDRWHKFRNRTSSANWSGSDRLTEEDVRKDLEARDKVRRQGGWTYDSMV